MRLIVRIYNLGEFIWRCPACLACNKECRLEDGKGVSSTILVQGSSSYGV